MVGRKEEACEMSNLKTYQSEQESRSVDALFVLHRDVAEQGNAPHDHDSRLPRARLEPLQQQV